MNKESFYNEITEVISDDEFLLIHHAYWLAKRAHEDQKRDNGERYFEHCRRVTLILIGINSGDAKTIITALLHDCLEDGFIHPKIIEKIFGTEIYEAIEKLSKTVPIFYIKNGFLKERAKKDIKSYYEGIAHAPKWIRKIKLADRIDNLSGMENWGEERKKRYLEETEAHFLPLAHKTDPKLAAKLEELCQKLRNSLPLIL